MFSVGISTAFGIINRLDRLMLAVKEIVGEQYHIHGVGSKKVRVPTEYVPYNGPTVSAPWSVNLSKSEPVEKPVGLRANSVHFRSAV